jgi:hypothetical protein
MFFLLQQEELINWFGFEATSMVKMIRSNTHHCDGGHQVLSWQYVRRRRRQIIVNVYLCGDLMDWPGRVGSLTDRF